MDFDYYKLVTSLSTHTINCMKCLASIPVKSIQINLLFANLTNDTILEKIKSIGDYKIEYIDRARILFDTILTYSFRTDFDQDSDCLLPIYDKMINEYRFDKDFFQFIYELAKMSNQMLLSTYPSV